MADAGPMDETIKDRLAGIVVVLIVAAMHRDKRVPQYVMLKLQTDMIAEAWRAPTEFDREMAISAIHIIGAGMSQAEMTNAGLRAVELLHATKA